MVLIDIICMQIVISIGLEELKRWLSFKRVDCHTQIETSNLLCFGCHADRYSYFIYYINIYCSYTYNFVEFHPFFPPKTHYTFHSLYSCQPWHVPACVCVCMCALSRHGVALSSCCLCLLLTKWMKIIAYYSNTIFTLF